MRDLEKGIRQRKMFSNTVMVSVLREQNAKNSTNFYPELEVFNEQVMKATGKNLKDYNITGIELSRMFSLYNKNMKFELNNEVKNYFDIMEVGRMIGFDDNFINGEIINIPRFLMEDNRHNFQFIKKVSSNHELNQEELLKNYNKLIKTSEKLSNGKVITREEPIKHSLLRNIDRVNNNIAIFSTIDIEAEMLERFPEFLIKWPNRDVYAVASYIKEHNIDVNGRFFIFHMYNEKVLKEAKEKYKYTKKEYKNLENEYFDKYRGNEKGFQRVRG